MTILFNAIQETYRTEPVVFSIAFGMLIFLFVFVIAIAFFIFWLLMLIDSIKRKFKGDEKLLWVLVIIFANWIGAIIYYFLVYRNKKK